MKIGWILLALSGSRIVSAQADPLRAPASSARSYVVTEVTVPATLEGRLRFAGTPPSAPPFDAGTTTPGSCGGPGQEESLLVGAEGGVANAVVALERIPAGKPWPSGPGPVLDQQGCVFVPHVLTSPVGGLLEVKNSDQVFHNVHAYTWSGRYSPFNLAMPPGSAPVTQSLDRPGILSLRCDAGHRWMSGYIYVGRTPYHVLTDREGRFRINGIPAGDHEVTVWHERFGVKQVPVSLGPSATTTLELQALSGPDRLEVPTGNR